MGVPGASLERQRLESIDLLRGLIMIVMALDHTRDFFGIPGQNPTNLASASAALFLTRWITYYCAPVFFLLTGTGAYLSLRRRTPGELSRFLLTRGLWLIFLELVVVRALSYQFNLDFRMTMLVVLWALGWSMIVLGALVRLPVGAIIAFGAILIAGHNLFDSVRSANPIWSILHSPGFVLNTPEHVVFVAYPLIPWIGVTAMGFALGQVYSWESERRRAFLLGLGSALTLGFLVIRGINAYGDAARWATQKSALFTALSFLNTTKYPPSLLFLLMTLGPMLVVLWAVDRGTPRALRARGDDRESAALLLRPALLPDSSPGSPGLLRAKRLGALDVRIARSRALSVQPAAWLGLLAAGRLPDLGWRGSGDVSALPVVRGGEAAAEDRAVGELSLTMTRRRRSGIRGSVIRKNASLEFELQISSSAGFFGSRIPIPDPDTIAI